jgi:PAS domain S-box-containing protein
MVRIPARTQVAVQRVDLASIVGFSTDAFIGMTSSGVISEYNRAAALLYGYAMSDLVGKHGEVIVPPERRAEEKAILRRVVAGEDVDDYRTQRLCRDGTIVAVSLAISPIVDSAGAVLGVATFARCSDKPRRTPDRVTVQRGNHAEPRVDVSQLGKVEEDRQSQAHIDAEYAKERVRVHQAQDRFQAVMGDERVKERVHVHEAQDRFQVRMGEERVREQAQVEDAQDRFRDEAAAGLARAQSDTEQLQAQLNQGQRLEVLGQLAGGVAHDFNNLLAVILNYAAFVVEELANPVPDLLVTSRDVGQIQRAAERAAGLTRQLLAFARREVIQPQVLDLNHVVTELQQLLGRTIGDDIALHTDLAPDLWPVLADAGQFEQVLANLAVNARDAMSDGGTLSIDTANVIVDADADALLKAGRHVRLRVSDTGTGMPDDIIEHVFEPFFTTKTQGSGTGLGLSTVYGIVTQAQGSINIHSSPGAGTTFTILVPVTDEVAVNDEDVMRYERTPAGETILIVEDQDALREVTERIFTRSGYRVIAAASGAEAVRLAAEHDGEIHLLITDVVMPNMLGKEAAEKIRTIKPYIEVLFMSGYAQPVLALQGRLDRDVNLIEKPFSASAILEKAGRILNGHFDVSISEPKG